MNDFSQPMLPRRVSTYVFLNLALAFGCTGTETGNPLVDSPDFESPTRFEPEPPTPPGCVPSDEDTPPKLDQFGESAGLLIGADPYRGLLVLDLSNPTAPMTLAQVPLAGRVRQLIVEPGPAVTLAIDELPSFAAPPVAPPAELDSVLRLVRFDLSNPSAPQRVGQVDLPGSFWEVATNPDTPNEYLVATLRLNPEALACNAPINLCGFVERDALTVQRYQWQATGFVGAEGIDLPSPSRVFRVPGGFATASGGGDAGQAGTITSARFDGTGLPVVQQLPFEGLLVPAAPIYIGNDYAAYFSIDFDNGTARLDVTDGDGNLLSAVEGLSQGLGSGSSLGDHAALIADSDSGSETLYVDLSDPTAPVVTALPNTRGLWPLDARSTVGDSLLLGYGAASAGTRFTLFARGPNGLSIRSELDAAFEVDELLALESSRALFSLATVNPIDRVALSITWSGDTLQVEGTAKVRFAEQVIAVDDVVYAPDAWGLGIADLGSGTSQTQTWNEQAIDSIALGQVDVSLVRPLAGPIQLEVTSQQGTARVSVSPGAERLLPAGDRVAVVSTTAKSQCEQRDLDCSNYQPSVSLFDVGEPPTLLTEIPLPEPVVPTLSAQSAVSLNWQQYDVDSVEPLRFNDEQWLLEAEFAATCLTPADCEALGIASVPIAEANVLVAPVADCAPGSQNCVPGTSEPPTVYGERRERRFYLLDTRAETLREVVSLPIERGVYLADPIVSGNTLLSVRRESLGSPATSFPETAHFLLDRFMLDDNGELQAQAPINIPGYALGLLDEQTLISVEPEPGQTGAARLHRVRLGTNGASIEATRSLQARFGEVTLSGDRAVYIALPSDRCEPVVELQVIALDAAFSPLGALELPGLAWEIADTDDNELLLRADDRRTFVVIDLNADPLRVTQFFTTERAVAHPTWSPHTLRGTSDLGGVVKLGF